ncbi:hypothetical protein ACSMXN_07595 [Jatrophihabitans sp. DSM 45814]
MALGILVILALVLLVFLTVIPLYNRRTDRVAKLLPSGAWGHACVDPIEPRRWRVIVVDSNGIRILGRRGQSIRGWGWAQIESATPGPVTTTGALMGHTGLVLGLADGSTVGALLPSRSTFRYPPEVLSEALREIRRRQPHSS